MHVTAIRRYERLRSLGFPPAAIRLLPFLRGAQILALILGVLGIVLASFTTLANVIHQTPGS